MSEGISRIFNSGREVAEIVEVTKQQVSSKNAISGVALLSTVRKRGDAIGMILDVSTMQICFVIWQIYRNVWCGSVCRGRFFCEVDIIKFGRESLIWCERYII